MENQFVSYIRVSTQKQQKSGLGLQAQRQDISVFLADRGNLLQEFKEVESGKSTKNRPVLKDALAYCFKHKATLVVARLDRLARNVAFVSALMESKVDFVCVDFPQWTNSQFICFPPWQNTSGRLSHGG